MNENEIHVAFCTDSNYLPQLAAALVSMYISNAGEDLRVYLVSSSISKDAIEKITIIAKTFGRTVTFIDINNVALSDLRVNLQPTSAYYRLLLPRLLPDLQRIIYLDCDLVVEICLRDLWDVDLSDNACAAYPEPLHYQGALMAHVGIKDRYVNSGVLLLDLDYWRSNNIGEQCIEWVKTNPERATMMDQDAINVVLENKKMYLSRKWNLNPIHGPIDSLLSEYGERILHFAGPIKPWNLCYDFGLSDLFYRYLSLTPFAKALPPLEPNSIGQAVSVANQYYSISNYVKSCNYYQVMVNFKLELGGLDNILVLRMVNFGHDAFNIGNYKSASDHYRACVEYWGYPLHHSDIYNIPGIFVKQS